MLEEDNGNGSLMRIMPLLFAVKDLSVEDRYIKVKEVSSLTHAHFRSVFACFIYVEIALHILKGESAEIAHFKMCNTVLAFADKEEFSKLEMKLFGRVLSSGFKDIKEQDIHSGGYVLHTLEAAVWCLLNTDNYTDAVLKAVNLGGDTDTTACVTGGLAGLLYGYDEILNVWKDVIARSADIENLCERLNKQLKL